MQTAPMAMAIIIHVTAERVGDKAHSPSLFILQSVRAVAVILQCENLQQNSQLDYSTRVAVL